MLDPGVVEAARLAQQTRPAHQLGTWARRLGPGAVVSIAYVDPGNFATNTQAGAEFGSRLLWVVALASIAAMVLQYLAAKLGSVTGRSLPQLCRELYPRPVTWLLWAQAELVVAATDLAEMLGGALALQLLLHVPLVVGAGVMAVASVGLVTLRSPGRRLFHVLVASALIVVLIGFLFQAWALHISWLGAAGGLQPSTLGDSRALLLATGIIGATVMPHAIYLHSDLARTTPSPATRLTHLRWHRRDVVTALGVAGVANLLILLVAAAAFSTSSGTSAREVTLHDAYRQLERHSGLAATAFACALLAAGLAASAVGTNAGDVVMVGFLRRRIPAFARRVLTLTPGFVVIAIGVDPTQALLWSQVLLSLGIPFALVPLIHLTSRHRVMGESTNRACAAVAGLITFAVCVLNGVLVYQTVG